MLQHTDILGAAGLVLCVTRLAEYYILYNSLFLRAGMTDVPPNLVE